MAQDSFLKAGDEGFRARQYGTISYDGNNEIIYDDSGVFFQSEEINEYAGGISRQFQPIPKEELELIQPIIKEIEDTGFIEPNVKYEYGCHKIRVSVGDDEVFSPTPEGYHQDGFDYVAMVCVNKKNVVGATSFVKDIDTNRLTFQGEMQPGDMMIVDDRLVKHYVSPLFKSSWNECYRDMLIITFKIVN